MREWSMPFRWPTWERARPGRFAIKTAKRLWRSYLHRQQIRALLSYDTRMLRDIGLTHDDVRRYASMRGMTDDKPDRDEPSRLAKGRGR
jgi:uncharacterized protein YjiS (DUF1127 family)